MNFRFAVYDAINLVVVKNHTIDSALDEINVKKRFAVNDQNAIRNLLSYSIRHYGQAKRLIKPYIKGFNSIPSETINLLVISVVDIIINKSPAYAVIDCANEISKEKLPYKIKPFINGVLRSFNRDNHTEFNSPSIANLRRDMIDDWTKSGYDVQAIVDTLMLPPPLDLKIFKNYSKVVSAIREMGYNVIELPFHSIRLYPFKGKVYELPFFDDGYYQIQGFCASLAVESLGLEGNDNSHLKALDVCAAPGGKSFQLANLGIETTSIDINENRVKLMKENVKRLKLPLNIINEDFFDHQKEDYYDIVLADLPCSATGMLRRHPEINLRNNKNKSLQIAKLQINMLKRASSFAKKDGHIILALCAISYSETMQNLYYIQDHMPWLRVESIHFKNSELNKMVHREGCMLMLPDYLKESGGSEGFFIVKMRKRYSKEDGQFQEQFDRNK